MMVLEEDGTEDCRLVADRLSAKDAVTIALNPDLAFLVQRLSVALPGDFAGLINEAKILAEKLKETGA
jgi:hypothetical protein